MAGKSAKHISLHIQQTEHLCMFEYQVQYRSMSLLFGLHRKMLKNEYIQDKTTILYLQIPNFILHFEGRYTIQGIEKVSDKSTMRKSESGLHALYWPVL